MLQGHEAGTSIFVCTHSTHFTGNDTTDTHEAGISPLLCSGRELLQEPCIQGDIEN